jgi:hypothetical protein
MGGHDGQTNNLGDFSCLQWDKRMEEEICRKLPSLLPDELEANKIGVHLI